MKFKSKLVFLVTILFFLHSNSIWGQRYGFHKYDSTIVTHNTDTLKNAWAGGMNSVQFSTIDLNFDGEEDLVSFDRTGDYFMTYLYEDNHWKHHPEFEAYFPSFQGWVLFRDYNCDGKKDIFTYTAGGMGVWKNTSTTELSFELITIPYLYSMQFGNYVNLYVSRVDIPDISDIDNDGDLDILTFGVIGTRIEYHRNLAIENGYGCDTLIYELRNNCWGHFAENGLTSNACVLYDTCTNNTTSPEKSALKHSGSVSLTMDLNADGTTDILLGDVSYPNIVALTNDNKGPNMNTSFVAQDTLFPSYNVPADVELFPGMYYEDIDHDGIKDLLVSPNTDIEAKTHQSVWLYHNAGANNNPNFQFISKSFIQDEMFDLGTGAYPVFFDYDNDGLMDLFISNFGFYEHSQSDYFISQIYQYRNVGTLHNPEFTLIDTNFLDIPNSGIEMSAYPTFADIDNDNDVDLFIGDYEGNVHFFENTSSSPSSLNLTLNTFQLTDDNTDIIDVGAAAKPQLFDLDQDNDFDLVVGTNNGKIYYYENVGDASNFIFRAQTDQLGNIDVSEWWTTIGSAIPLFFRNSNNETQLFVGSERGYIFHYDSIDNDLYGTYNQVDSMVAGIYIGPTSAPAIADINNDQIIDMIVGTERGGLTLFYGDNSNFSGIELNEPENTVLVFPNPGKGNFNIKCNNFTGVTVYNMTGQLISKSIDKTISLENETPGVYIFRISSNEGVTNKLVILK